MKAMYISVLSCILGLSLVGNAARAQDAGQGRDDKASKGILARGKYIVEGVATCSQCHTPHDKAGNMDRARWLQGGPVWLMPAMPVSDWPLKAPRIAGLLPGSDSDVITQSKMESKLAQSLDLANKSRKKTLPASKPEGKRRSLGRPSVIVLELASSLAA